MARPLCPLVSACERGCSPRQMTAVAAKVVTTRKSGDHKDHHPRHHHLQWSLSSADGQDISKLSPPLSSLSSSSPSSPSSPPSVAHLAQLTRRLRPHFFFLSLLLLTSTVVVQCSSSFPRHSSSSSQLLTSSSSRSSAGINNHHHKTSALLHKGGAAVYHGTSSTQRSVPAASVGAAGAAGTQNAPAFAEVMQNVTMAVGKDVTFECVVDNLGSYKLAWLKVANFNGGGGSGSGSGDLLSALALTEPEIISIQTQIVLSNGSSSAASASASAAAVHFPHHLHNNNNHHNNQQHQNNNQDQNSIQTSSSSSSSTSGAVDSRYRVSHANHRQWFLHLKQIKPSDRGYYMCQINTEPIISQAAFLDVLIAPSIDYNATSSDVSVDERHRLSIRCRAKGHPPPTIIWRREDNKEINLGQYGGMKYSASKVEGEFLNITQVTRDDMGAYLCIASNSVPPSVSKRIIVRVNFRPKIRVSNQVVGSMLGSDVQLECRCEASPTPTTAWIRSDGHLLTPSAKYLMREEHDSYRTKMKLKIVSLDEKDFGSYKCVAKNAIGEKEGLVRLYEMALPSTPSGGGGNSGGDQSGGGGNGNGHNPTFTYSYQGGRNGGNFSDNVFGGNNNNNLFDSDYQQAASSATSSFLLLQSPHFVLVLLTTIGSLSRTLLRWWIT